MNDEQVAGVCFTRDTYPHKDFFKSIGCKWSPKRHCWYLENITNKDELLRKLDLNKIPYGFEDNIMSRGMVKVFFEYDSLYHHRISVNNGCTCTDRQTCRYCTIACCSEAKRILEPKGFSGIATNCEVHGTRMDGTFD